MKKIGLVFSLVLFFSVTFQVNAQWFWQNPLPQGNNLNDVEFIDNFFGLAVGETGTILKSTDGGLTWKQKNSSTSKVIYKVDVTDSTITYALGSYFLLKTTDGGESWFNLSMPATTYFNDIFFFDNLRGYLVGSNSNLFSTSDGGETWKQEYGISSDILKVINFFNENIGVVVGYNLSNYDNVVLKTTNGGNTWIRFTFPSSTAYSINDVDFVTETKLIAVAYENIYYSTNGGQNWVTSSIGSSILSSSIDFIDSYNGVISGHSGSTDNARIFRTQDGGQSWQEIVFDLGGNSWLNSITFPNSNFIYSVGANGRMVRSNNGGNSWEIISSGPLNSLHDVSFYDANNGIAVGSGILRTTNGGTNWEMVSNFSALLRCISPWQNTYFAVGGHNLLKSTDNGLTWIRNPVSENNYFMTISFADSLNGVATTMLGTEPKVFRTFDGGENWLHVATIQGHTMFDICFVDTQTIFASASSAIVYKSTDGGYNWTELLTGGDNTLLYGIDFINSLIGYTVGYSGVVIKTLDGGFSWQILNVDLGNGLGFKQVDFIDENNGLVGGGIVAHTSDGGLTWEGFDLFFTSIYSCEMLNDSTWYAVGSDGAILKRESDYYTPVEIVEFNLSVSANDILLNWQTTTETNNQGFQIERRETNNEKSGEWINIGFVIGNGTTTEPQSYLFVDKNLVAGKYLYRLKQIDFDGTFEYSNTIEIEIGIPVKFSLEQNYPNPFNPSTKISWQAPVNSWQTLRVYDILGNEVATLVNEYRKAGHYEIEFQASVGSLKLASGIYYYQLRAGDYVETKKMVLLK